NHEHFPDSIVNVTDFMDSGGSRTLKIGALNICGVLSKLNFPEFHDFVNIFDVICLVETKLDHYDSFQVEGYDVFTLNRNSKKGVRCGGIAVLIRSELCKYVSILEGGSADAVWFLIKKNPLVIKDIICGAIYISPEGSRYCTLDCFDFLERDLMAFVNEHENSEICLFGDFNARTSNLDDSLFIDDNTLNNLNIDFDMLDCSGSHNVSSIPDRVSYDKKVNNYGYRLIELCKTLGINILNGRCGMDKNLGLFTCKDASVVDYIIASPNLFQSVIDFQVLDFDSILSDVHCPLVLHIDGFSEGSISSGEVPQNNISEVRKKIVWKNDSHTAFAESISLDEVREVCTLMDEYKHINDDNINNLINVDTLVDKCNKILLKAAEDSGNVVNITDRSNVGNIKRKPWYNNECKMLRKEYHRSKNYNRRQKTVESRLNVVRASKAYKKAINKQFRAYQSDVVKKLRDLQTTNPKAYWSIINRSCDSKKVINDISVETFYDHFKGLNQENDSEYPDISAEQVSDFNIELNREISEFEIKQAIKSLKNNKACADDLIRNEFIKASESIFMPIYVRLFNIVLDTGCVPEIWTKGFIVPIFKNKGSKENPDNYRGITILSCMGKLFTSILNARINDFLESYGILGEEQAGFRKTYGTNDHLFNLKCLIDLFLFKKKRLFCAFIDYKKAFDSVDRAALWHKLLNNSIDGKIFVLIKNMYSQAKSCIKVNGCNSDFFTSGVGVRQGENLSPILFSLFLNDLSEFLSHSFNGLEHVTNLVHQTLDTQEIEVYMRLYMLLYADDTVLLAESADELQAALNAMFLYCKTWNLTVNPTKTKIVVFSKSNYQDRYMFRYDGKALDVETDFSYLGMTFDRKGKFFKARTRLIGQARRASFAVIRKSRKLNLPVDIQLKLFDHMIAPIILYGSEIWGYENCELIELFHFKYCKQLLHLKSSTPKVMVYGELGRYPMQLYIKSRMVSFWAKILCGKKDKLAFTLYKVLYQLDSYGEYHSQWLDTIRTTLRNVGLGEFWDNQFNYAKMNNLKERVDKALRETYIQTWHDQTDKMSKCLNYRLYKTEYECESYFSKLPMSLGIYFSRFRCMNHRLPIEFGRFSRLERAKRKCKLCGSGDLGDEFHYLFKCSYFKRQRKKSIPMKYLKNPNVLKFHELMNTEDVLLLTKVASFCRTIVSF
ncbi:MAG: reverse transcriptase family protein, partial [Candidatus Thiodiazotropha sp.]